MSYEHKGSEINSRWWVARLKGTAGDRLLARKTDAADRGGEVVAYFYPHNKLSTKELLKHLRIAASYAGLKRVSSGGMYAASYEHPTQGTRMNIDAQHSDAVVVTIKKPGGMKESTALGGILQEMRDQAGIEESLTEASGMRGTFAEYLGRAEKAFLNAAAKEIKKIAGARAENVAVKQGRPGGPPWLDYEGQDKSDIDLEFTASLTMSQPNKITIHWNSRSAYTGRDKGRIEDSIGQATPGAIVQAWLSKFGR